MKNRLTLAVQKSGRLSERTGSMLREAGIALANGSTAALRTDASNFPLDVLYLRDDDIPECVAEGIADAGVVGENVHVETERGNAVVERLGFARCRLSIAVPRDAAFTSSRDLDGCSIATSYPRTLSRFLERRGLQATIRVIAGSAEITPSIGMADAVCDLVSTGSTLISNGLREIETVTQSEALLVANQALGEQKRRILDDLVFRIRAVLNAREYKYILLNCPNNSVERVTAILPGIKSPTVMPLTVEGWSSLHTVVREDEFWEIIESLREAGAEGVLVLPVEKMVM
jgi:ATP phosphoribosyltransferase